MTDSVLITGAGTGLGLTTALHLASHGYAVYATVLNAEQREHVEAQATAHGVGLRPRLLDVTDDTSIQTAVSAIVAECGGVFGVIHNAGLSLRGYFEDLDDEEIRRVLEVNLFGAMTVTRAVLPHMRAARRGRLIFISSVGGRIASMARTAYCASKFGLEGFAESLLQEVSPLGIQVSIVEPAIIKTERWTVHRGIARRALDPQSPYHEWFRAEEKLADTFVRSSPTKPEEVASTVLTALTTPRPRLRYVVGRRARPVLALRRYMPGELFERLYFGAAMYRVTRSKQPMVDSSPAAAPRHLSPFPIGNNPGAKKNNVISLVKAVQVLGLRSALRANKIKRFSNDALSGFYTTRALVALYNVGFLPELSQRGSIHLRAFAAEHNLDATVLEALATYLYSVRVLKRRGDTYAYDRTQVIAETLNGPFQTVYAYQDVFHNLEALLRQEKSFGVDVKRDGELVATGSGAVGKLLIFPMVVDVLRQNKFDCVLDLCCGDATMLVDVCTRARNLRGYGVDISPEAVAAGRKNLEEHNLRERVQLLVGDAFNLDAIAAEVTGVQAATCVYALHEFASASSDRAVEMLRSFKRGFPGVPLIIGEVIQQTPEELRQRPGGVAEIQLWHDLSKQHLLTRAEWHSLFARAGFANVREDYMRFARTAIFTVS